jgi:ketosteroid isomerase-like protein
MTRWSHAVALLALSSSIASAQTSATKAGAAADGQKHSAAERAVLALEEEWAQSLVRRNAAPLRRFLTSDWTYADEHGWMNKSQMVSDVETGSDTVTRAGNEKVQVRVFGSTAVATGILTLTGHGAAGPFDRRYNYTDVWVRRAGRWYCVASHDTLEPKSQR